jgi:hypothetical protein
MTITSSDTAPTEMGSHADLSAGQRPATPRRRAQIGSAPGGLHSEAKLGRQGVKETAAKPTHQGAPGNATGPRKPLPVAEALAEVRDHIDIQAGRDHTREIDRLRAETAGAAELTEWVGETGYHLDRLRWERHLAAARLAYAREIEKRTSPRPGWLRPSHSESTALARAAVAQARLEKKRIEDRLNAEEHAALKARHQQERMQAALESLRNAEDAQRDREAWLDTHPEITAALHDLSERAKRDARRRGGGDRISDPFAGRASTT